MTPKEKAKDLVKGFRSTFIILVTNTKGELQFPYKSKYVANEVFEHQSKQCAIECVDEIIESIKNLTSLTIEERRKLRNEKFLSMTSEI